MALIFSYYGQHLANRIVKGFLWGHEEGLCYPHLPLTCNNCVSPGPAEWHQICGHGTFSEGRWESPRPGRAGLWGLCWPSLGKSDHSPDSRFSMYLWKNVGMRILEKEVQTGILENLPGLRWFQWGRRSYKESLSTPILHLCSPSLISWEGNGIPLQYSCLETPMDRGACWAAVHGMAKSRTWLNDFTFTFHFHAFEEEMATHSSVLAWRIPGMGEPGALPSMGSHRVGHDWSDLATAAAAAASWGSVCSLYITWGWRCPPLHLLTPACSCVLPMSPCPQITGTPVPSQLESGPPYLSHSVPLGISLGNCIAECWRSTCRLHIFLRSDSHSSLENTKVGG